MKNPADGELLLGILHRGEHLPQSQVVIRIRVRNDDRKRRSLRFRRPQVETPFQITQHIVGLARVHQILLVIGCHDMASVSLAHVDEIDLEDPRPLIIGRPDEAVGIPAMDPDELSLVIALVNRNPFVVFILGQIGKDKVAKEQLFLED